MSLPARIMTDPLPFEKERREMIEEQLHRRGIGNLRVLEAMYRVPRHEFVPPAQIQAAYDDRPLPIGPTETISQPYIVAAMTQAVRVEPGDKALEVGTGSGYQAAILAYLGAKVWTIERNPDLANAARERLARLGFKGIEVISGDGSAGLPEGAPFDIILVTAAAPEVPATLLDQLANHGRMIIPVGDLTHQELLFLFKHNQQIGKRVLDPCQFVPLIGKQGWPEKSSEQ